MFLDKYGDSLESMMNFSIMMTPMSEDGLREQMIYSVMDVFNVYKTMVRRSTADVPVAEPLNGASGLKGGAAAGLGLGGLMSAGVGTLGSSSTFMPSSSSSSSSNAP